MKHANPLHPPELKIKETQAGMIMQLIHEPKTLERPSTNDKLIQNHSIMYFQQLIMKKARAALRAKSLSIFKNDIAVEIEIVSVQSPNSLKLELVLKSIFDALNKSVITDDHLISNAQVWLYIGQKRYPKTKIHVRVEDLGTRENFHFSCEIPAIEKREAVTYNIASTMHRHASSAADIKMIEQAFSNLQTGSTKQHEICHILFLTSDHKKDVDNMLLMYIDILRKQGFLSRADNIGIGMYKRHVDKSDERVHINLVSK
ncbi:hypothetical protein JCM21714_2999 [Gracilibacillus boraciitolerans JCM 21714]|uniref:Uncharacterized protein n=1 Tax=Gracilibacillus boraciitolerans JCM 21714 TaxID=1298598 RepID=W4VKZ0_9BACI|nr:hypothetical protein [Gracilibacillus boraciitolerans]GAE93887.1 hypothetical protein JCM21714_2999 [Gracilibacillus boraciitolerans JCM 21714]